MTIPFKNIPPGLRTPLFFAEVDNSRANSGQVNQRALIIAQVTSSGSAAPGVPVLSQGVSDAIALGGPGSMLHLMVEAYRDSDDFGEVWLLPLADAGGSTAAAGSIAFSSPPTAAGVLSLYVAGEVVPVALAAGMTTAQVATAVAAAINANTNLPVTASPSTNTVAVTAKNKGQCGNEIDLRVNYGGAPNGEATPAGLAFTITAMSGGATNPTLATALANLPAQPYDFIVNPYTDSTNLAAMTAYLKDATGAWSWSQKLYGHAFGAYRGTVSALGTFGNGLNDQHASILGFNDSPTPAWIVAADFAAAAAVSLRADPARPLQTLTLSTMLPPPLNSRFHLSERNTLLYDGISTFTVRDDGACALENVITTYQTNAFGQPDDSYLQVETMFTLMLVLRRLESVVTSRYARVKLAADGTRFAAGSAIVTPSIIKADLIAEFRQLEYEGYVQGADAFARNLIVEQNATNPNRVDVLWPGALINQLRIFALLAQFRLTAS